MLKLGLIGYPLGHSLSAVMHKAAIAETGLPGDYALIGTPPEKLKNMIEFMKKSSFKGFNVTIPHKIAVMDYLDSVDKLALKIGAVNTVIIENNKRLTGHNTDAYGFMSAIPADIREHLRYKNAVIIGSGGAARAVAAGMAEMGIKHIEIIALKSEVQNAKEIQSILNKSYPGVRSRYKELNETINLADVSFVVNATPVGMEGELEGQSPISEYSISTLPEDCFVYDIVYKPRKTKLIKLAEKRELETLDGLDMLVLQGARAFHLWTGREAPVEVMKTAALDAL